MRANYQIVEKNDEYILIRDLGPWDRYMSVTNAAEAVVAEMAVSGLGDRDLFYYDSDGRVDEITHDGHGKFTGFSRRTPPGLEAT